MFYRPIFKSAWLITWRFKILWLFGFLASWGFLKSGSELNFLWRAKNWLADPAMAFPFWQGVWQSEILYPSNLLNFFKLAWLEPTVFIKLLLLLLLALAFFLLIVCFSVISKAVLIKSAGDLARKNIFTLSDSFKNGKNRFWRILFLSLIAKALITLCFVVLLLPFWLNFLSQRPGVSITFSLISSLIFLPLALVVSLIVKYATQLVVLEDRSIVKALSEGAGVFKKNILPSLEMLIFVAFWQIVLGVIMLVLFFFAAAPFIVVTAGSFLIGIRGLFWSGFFSTALVALFVLFLGAAIFTAFQWSAWTLFFERISSTRILSKLQRLAERIIK